MKTFVIQQKQLDILLQHLRSRKRVPHQGKHSLGFKGSSQTLLLSHLTLALPQAEVKPARESMGVDESSNFHCHLAVNSLSSILEHSLQLRTCSDFNDS